jgi:adenylyltransferase/sulfurtransferase
MKPDSNNNGQKNFSAGQQKRYSRHLALAELGPAGQSRLLNGSILIIGTGGLGSPAALYSAASGIGRIGIVDFDIVEISNLQRQIIHTTDTLGIPKVESAAAAIKALNPDIKVNIYNTRAKADNLVKLIEPYDLILDCVDNFETKFLINDTCVMNKKSFVHAGVLQFQGQLFVYKPGTACLRCLFPEQPEHRNIPTGNQVGVLGAQAGLIGVMQAIEAVKFLSGTGTVLFNSMLSYNSLTNKFNKTVFKKNRDCPVCSPHH